MTEIASGPGRTLVPRESCSLGAGASQSSDVSIVVLAPEEDQLCHVEVQQQLCHQGVQLLNGVVPQVCYPGVQLFDVVVQQLSHQVVQL